MCNCLCLYFFLTAVDFGYHGQELLFEKLDFGIDMESRSKSSLLNKVSEMFQFILAFVFFFQKKLICG